MPPLTTTVDINGYALREMRILTGIPIAALAEQVGVTRSYLAKIELGHSERVSPKVFAAIVAALKIKDRRALLAWPHGGSVAA